MLLFIDQPKHIRVVRSVAAGSGAMTRERVGQIAKATLEPPPELQSALQPDEQEELAKALEMFRYSREVSKRVTALKFPETMRMVVEYLQDSASDGERKIIVSAMMEGLRQIRKAAKADATQDLA